MRTVISLGMCYAPRMRRRHDDPNPLAQWLLAGSIVALVFVPPLALFFWLVSLLPLWAHALIVVGVMAAVFAICVIRLFCALFDR